MRVAKAASLALMLQERAEPSLLFLNARIAMILQILRTERHQDVNVIMFTFCMVLFISVMVHEGGGGEDYATLLRHLSLLADPQHLQRFALRVQRNVINLQLQVDSTKLWAVVKVVHGQLPQTSHRHKNKRSI